MAARNTCEDGSEGRPTHISSAASCPAPLCDAEAGEQPAFASGDHDTVRKGRLLRALRASGVATMAWCFDEGRIDLSYEASELLALPRGQSLSSFRALVRQVAPVDRPKALAWIWDNLLELPKEKKRFEIEFRSIRGSSVESQNWLRMEGQFDPEANSDHVVYFTITDVTESKRAAEQHRAHKARDERRLKDLERLTQELQTAQLRAEASVATQSRFLSVMSRDIRTPLNSLLGMLSLIDTGNLTTEDARKFQVAEEAGEQLRLLIDDLVDVAKSETGGLVLQTGTIELGKLVGESAAPWVKIGEAKNVVVSVRIDPACPQWIELDRARLRQLLDRMIGNAVGSVDQGHVSVRILPAQARRLCFVVETSHTNGAPTDVAARNRDDIALRSAICKKLVDALGGQTGSSALENGERNWAEIPCTAAYSPAINEQPVPALASLFDTPLRVLVAEDVLTNQMVVEGHLTRLGCDFACVANGEEAVRAVSENEFDIVLMDMAMPIMDGATAIRAIRALPDGRGQLPIVALTAYSRSEELEPMLEAGANGAVIKPVDIAELREALRSAIVS